MTKDSINNSVFFSSGLPPISYMVELITSEQVVVDIGEYYIKQSYRNRFLLPGPNGIQTLTIPIIKTHQKTEVKDIRISNDINWQILHWRTIETIYNKAPFFIFYREEIKSIFNKHRLFLTDFNTEMLDCILSLLNLNIKFEISREYIENCSINDYRTCLSNRNIEAKSEYLFPEYTQVFSERQGFIRNMSILDALFNLGPDTAKYLMSVQKILR